MTADDDPIAYTALTPGTPVLSAEGTEFGQVVSVLVDDKVDVFDGIVVGTPVGNRFVDADQVVAITRGSVRCSLSGVEAASLPAPTGSAMYAVDRRSVRKSKSNPFSWAKRKVRGSDFKRED